MRNCTRNPECLFDGRDKYEDGQQTIDILQIKSIIDSLLHMKTQESCEDLMTKLFQQYGIEVID